MEITKHGDALIKFRCTNCGCEWRAYIVECFGKNPWTYYCPDCGDYTTSDEKENTHD